MADSYRSKPGSRPRNDPSPVTPPAARDKTTPGSDPSAGKAGRIVHDARGNAVWDWVKDTTRIAIDSTSRLLKRLEVPELQMEDAREQEPRAESERDAGGGYDPYGGGSTPNRPERGLRGGDKLATTWGAGTGGRSTSGTGSANTPRGGTSNIGGGYDPYGKGVTPRKPTRKP